MPRSPMRSMPAPRPSSAAATRSRTPTRSDNDTRVKAYDQVWVKHIKAALMENRFRLVQQPIASLQGGDTAMYDVLLRMLDVNGKEVLPGEFMPAAERNDLLKNIDRWVVGASLSFAAQRKPGCLFVRLSQETLKDGSFLGWVENQVRATRSDPQRAVLPGPGGRGRQPPRAGAEAQRRTAQPRIPLRGGALRFGPRSAGDHRPLPIEFREDRRRPRPGRSPAARTCSSGCGLLVEQAKARTSRPSPSASRMRTPWRCCGSWACSTSRATWCTRPKRSCWRERSARSASSGRPRKRTAAPSAARTPAAYRRTSSGRGRSCRPPPCSAART